MSKYDDKRCTAPCHLCFDRPTWHSTHTHNANSHTNTHARQHTRTQSQQDLLGIFSKTGPPKGKEAGTNQLVSGLQTPAAPYRHAQADTLSD